MGKDHLNSVIQKPKCFLCFPRHIQKNLIFKEEEKNYDFANVQKYISTHTSHIHANKVQEKFHEIKTT